MKKGTAIKEDNKARQFAAVQKVVINNTSSGTSLWVPEDIAETDELSVTENGVYCAYDDNVFGYSQVVVNVSESLNDRSEKEKAISKITGTNPDTGDTESYGVDENGNLTKDIFPSGLPQAIHIVIAPTKNRYAVGETLDFTGIHVYLLDGEGHQWTSDTYPTGEIPFEELVFPVTIADPEANPESIGGGRTYVSVPSNSCYTIISLQGEESGVHQCLITDNEAEVRATGLSYPSNGGETSWQYCFVSTKQFNFRRTSYNSSSWAPSDDACSNMISSSPVRLTYKNKDYFIYMTSFGTYRRYDSWSSVICSLDTATSWEGQLTSDEAIERTFGDGASGDENMSIPVQWIRGDGKTLEDTYQITVTANSQPASGGSSSGGEHTGGDF